MPAIGVHHTGTVDTPWDGPAAVAAMPAEYATLHFAHAWWTPEAAESSHMAGDGDADDQKSSYKFPHHTKQGGPANLAACQNGLDRLDSADMPPSDDTGVRAHLQAHLDDGKKKSGNGASSHVHNADGTITYADASGDELASAFGRMTADARIRAHFPRVQRLSNRTDWFRITDAANGQPARLDIYDEIGFWGISSGDFNAQLEAISGDRIAVHIDSPGGDVFDGVAICNMLRAHPAAVDVVVDGLAASAASLIAMAGDTVTMMPQSQMMIHNASGVCAGFADDMTYMAKLLNRLSDSIAGAYAARAGGTAADWRVPMDAETWYSPEEAVAAGLADEAPAPPARKGTPKTATEASPRAAWNLSFYAYDGRENAPAPQDPGSSRPQPEAEEPPVFQFDPQQLRDAMKEAAYQ